MGRFVRYYDPVAGKFLSADPVLTDYNTGDSFNRYTYALNNPYKYVDPDGRNPWILRATYSAAFRVATTLGAERLGILIGATIFAATHKDPLLASSNSSNSSNSSLFRSFTNSTNATPPPDGDEKPKLISNPKHHKNSVSPEPKNVDQLYSNSIVDSKGVRWAKDAEGNLHRFSKPSNGEVHWNGSTTGVDPIKPQNIPNNIKQFFDFL